MIVMIELTFLIIKLKVKLMTLVMVSLAKRKIAESNLEKRRNSWVTQQANIITNQQVSNNLLLLNKS
jgi:hypothetical protein